MNQGGKKLTDFFNKPNEYINIKKNEYLILFCNWYHVGTVIRLSMSLFFDEKNLNFHKVKIYAIKNAFTLAKRPVRCCSSHNLRFRQR